MSNCATAVFFPEHAKLKDAVEEAVQMRPAHARLVTDGKRVAWMPRVIPGWFPVSTAAIMKRAA